MSRILPSGLFSNLRGDFFGGVTAAIVALPLALAFGLASGAGPLAGLYGAIFVGFFSALFGGTPAQVSGPTGPMTVAMAAIIVQFQHDPAMAFTVVILGGVLQVLFGLMGLGRYITYMPYPVISGFMSGIGVIIIILQLGAVTGHDPGGAIIGALAGLPGAWLEPSIPALAAGGAALSMMLFMPKKWRVFLPPPLAALILSTLVSLYLLPGAPVLGDMPKGLPVPHLPPFDIHALPQMLSAALILAMLGSIDSLLTSLVADNFTRTQHHSDRELIGQGIGNMFSGLFGGLAGSGATMRTVVNIRAGGRTQMSGMLHALMLLAGLVGLGFLVADIPKAALAGILLKVGWDIIDWPFLSRLRHAGIRGADRQALIVMATVLVLTVFSDLIMAVAVGVIMESLVSARRLSTHQIDDVHFATAGSKTGVRHRLSADDEYLIDKAGGRLLLLRFTGPLSFGTARDLSSRLQSIYDSYEAVLIDLTDARMMDISIMVTLADMIDRMMGQGKKVYVSGTANAVYENLQKHGILQEVPAENHYSQRSEALAQACRNLGV